MIKILHRILYINANNLYWTISGIQIIVVGMGTPQDAANFKKTTGYNGTIYIDTKQDLFRATNCKRGAKYILNANSKEAAKKVFGKNYKMGEFSGDFTWVNQYY